MIGILVFAFTSLIGTAYGELHQTKYDVENGLFEIESDRLVRLIPATKYDHPDQESLPYVIVAPEDYKTTLKKYESFHDKPENHVLIRDRETIVLKASDIDFEKHKEKEGSIDGVKTVFVPDTGYEKFLTGKKTAPGLPRNYVLIGVETILVLPAQ